MPSGDRFPLHSESKDSLMSQNSKPDTSSSRVLSDLLLAAVVAFNDDDRMLNQSAAIDAFTGLVDSPEDLAARISTGRAIARLGLPETWTPAEDGKGPQSYADAVAAVAAGVCKISPSTISKHRAAWTLVSAAGLSHKSVAAYGDAFAIVRGGKARAAKAPAARVSALVADERETAWHRIAVALVGIAGVQSEARRAKAAEAAETRRQAAEAAEADPVGALLATIGALRDALNSTGEVAAIRALEAGLRLQAEDARRAADALEEASAEAAPVAA